MLLLKKIFWMATRDTDAVNVDAGNKSYKTDLSSLLKLHI